MPTEIVVNVCLGGFGLSQHDPVLGQTVKELQEEAYGDNAELVIETIQGNKYIIHEYDGYESVQEPRHIKWIVAEQY